MAADSLFTIGHSNHSIDYLVGMLKAYGIQLLVDVRSVPRSRYNPQFNEDTLAGHLQQERIHYCSMRALGGKRTPRADSINTGFHEGGFRGYADYMQTQPFQNALIELIGYASDKRTVIMCAEANPANCHRSLISDALMVQDVKVIEILSHNVSRPHAMTNFAVARKEGLYYPSAQPLLF